MKIKLLIILVSLILLTGCLEELLTIQEQGFEEIEAPLRDSAQCNDGFGRAFQEPFANWMLYDYYIDCKTIDCCCCYVKTHILDFGQIFNNSTLDLEYMFAPRNRFGQHNYTMNGFYSTDKENWNLFYSKKIYSEEILNHLINVEESLIIDGKFKYLKLEVETYGGYLDGVSASAV